MAPVAVATTIKVNQRSQFNFPLQLFSTLSWVKQTISQNSSSCSHLFYTSKVELNMYSCTDEVLVSMVVK